MDSSKKYKNPNPKLNANFCSKLFFWWMKPLFWYGKDHDLELEHIYNVLPEDVSQHLGNRLEKNWKKEIYCAHREKGSPSLRKAIQKTFFWTSLYYGFWQFILHIVLRMSTPLMMSMFIWHFDPQSDSTTADAYMYGSAVVILTILQTIFSHNTLYYQTMLGMRVRIACSSLIYRKILRLSNRAVGKTTSGQIINLLANDVARFDQVFMHLHYLWIMPIEVTLITYIIWQKVQVATLAGVSLLVLQTIPVQGYLTRWISNLRLKVAARSDERIRLMSEIIGGIQVIKMYTWEKPFEKLVSLARSYEIDVLTKLSYLRGFTSATYIFTERTTLFVTILAYVLRGNQISAHVVFTLATYFNILQLTVAIYTPLALSAAAEAAASIKRLETFLSLEETRTFSQPPQQQPGTNQEGKAIIFRNVTASWVDNSIANTLHNINVHIREGKLCALVGSVGAGKSSLLQLILGELQTSQGQLFFGGTVSFASQEPWLFHGSVRNNILFGQPYDQTKYHMVTRVCSLIKDFEQFPQGDKTLVGDRGTSLSGGQRARINLARAVYRDADIYLLDDPLSAVDAHVGKELFANCITGYLQNKTRILVTHQVQYLKDVDYIIALHNGQVEFQGTYKDFQKHNIDFLNISESEDSEEVKSKDDGKHEEYGNEEDKITFSTTQAAGDEKEQEEPQETEELMAKGSMKKSVYTKYIRAGATSWLLLALFAAFVLGQFGSSGSDYWVAHWTKQEELRLRKILQNDSDFVSSGVQFTTPYASVMDPSTVFTETTEFTESTDSTFLENVTDTAWNLQPEALMLETESPEFASNGSFTDPANSSRYLDVNTALMIYGGFVLVCVIMTTARNLLFSKVCMNASTNLHNSMFSCLLKAPMRFFEAHPAGRILNRFSKDIGSVDEILPRTVLQGLQIFAVLIGILIQVLIVNWWTIFVMIALSFLYNKIRVIYLSTAQDVKRLEGIAKSPVFSHVNSSLQGLTTIRASKAQEMVRKEFDVHQDLHTGAYFLVASSSTAFGIALDAVSASFVAFVTYSFIILDDGTTFAGNVGLVISQILIICGMLQYGIRQLAESVAEMTSVERILQFTKLEKEGPFDSDLDKKPPKSWPDKGFIEFDHVYLRYSDSSDPVLKNLNFIISPTEKVGIVGRTGAGKSSTISALFNLAKLDGRILIDDINILDIGLHDLRDKISIIPQEPVLFSATLRDNLDPFHKYEDVAVWSALEEVELKDLGKALDQKVNAGGSNFSVGQRQLLCLARAILRNNKILVLDEATANVDPVTDSLIQKTIRRKFRDCTVLTIAHRLDTIADSDKVLVMDHGEVVEFDHPHLLLQDESGSFSKMVQQLGHNKIEQLKLVAAKAYKSKMNEKRPFLARIEGDANALEMKKTPNTISSDKEMNAADKESNLVSNDLNVICGSKLPARTENLEQGEDTSGADTIIEVIGNDKDADNSKAVDDSGEKTKEK